MSILDPRGPCSSASGLGRTRSACLSDSGSSTTPGSFRGPSPSRAVLVTHGRSVSIVSM